MASRAKIGSYGVLILLLLLLILILLFLLFLYVMFLIPTAVLSPTAPFYYSAFLSLFLHLLPLLSVLAVNPSPNPPHSPASVRRLPPPAVVCSSV